MKSLGSRFLKLAPKVLAGVAGKISLIRFTLVPWLGLLSDEAGGVFTSLTVTLSLPDTFCVLIIFILQCLWEI